MAQSPQPVFSQKLRVCLMEDACLRAHARQLQTMLGEIQSAARQTNRDRGLARRLLAIVARRKHTPAGPAGNFSREKEMQREYRAVEQILLRYTEDLDALLAKHLQETMPVFLAYTTARKRLGEWEGAVEAVQTGLHEVLKALGQARNAATSGYNKSKRVITATAREQFNKADEIVRSFEAKVKLANERARQHGDLPEVAIPAWQNAVKKLPQLEIGAMQKEFDRLTKVLEAFETEQLANLKEPVVQAAAQREEQARAYLVRYREELREFSDRQMTPDDMARAIPIIQARFNR